MTVTKDASGLYYQIKTPGNGASPTVNSTVRVAYAGTLLDGTPFDSSQNFQYPLASLIKGWQIGIPLVKTDGRILLIIPSALGYGANAAGKIPANSVLLFTIDLFSFQG
ncbi:MAG: hypothetical protein EOP44_04275 [Sphingobacteriaceae bacterium]|nr:MAG: hypothetical protein EOP44_04275 [Sphingobacteriaceae bacterium]